jgi:alkylation response protein AidB-like acyl-CoA dehydrogenase
VSTETTNARALAAMLREAAIRLGSAELTRSELLAIVAELERLADLEAAIVGDEACQCSPGDECSCAYDCECRERFVHRFFEDAGTMNCGPRGLTLFGGAI